MAHYPYAYAALVWLGNGDGFDDPVVWADTPKPSDGGENLHSTLVDVDGDGRADVVSAGVEQVHVHLSTGDAFVYAPEWDVASDLPVDPVSRVGLGSY